MPRHGSLAEYYRAHREAFLLAQELGCTPKEAERELRRRARTRLRACGTRAPNRDTDPAETFEPMDRAPADYRDWRAPWMMRD